MAFFDNLTKKVSEATQTVTQKGKDLADITKLNFAIADEEKKVDEVYKKIGKLFVEKVGDRAEGTFAELVAEIKASEAKIAESKDKIKELKGIITCEKCGNELPADAVFCNSCGAKVAVAEETPAPVEAPANENVCPKCGATTEPDAVFCGGCGQKLK